MYNWPVARIPVCVECGQMWGLKDPTHWQAYWIDDDNEDELIFCCAACAKRELGSADRSSPAA